MAWRNSNRCIGRLFWDSLNVIDARDVTDVVLSLSSITYHITQATNEGKLKPYITKAHAPRMDLKFSTIN